MARRRPNILITRPESSLSHAFLELPADKYNVCPCPTITIRAAHPTSQMSDIFNRIPTFDFVVFTSQNTVAKTAEYLCELGVSLEQFNQTRVCAVGPVTAEKLNSVGIKADVVPKRYTAQVLADLFPVAHSDAPKVLFPRGDLASGVLQSELTRKGYQVTSPIMYLTVPRNHLEVDAKRLIDDEEVDCFAFTSPSSVVALKSLLGESSFIKLTETAVIAAIGSITAAACVDAGVRVDLQPEDYTLHSLAKVIASHFGGVANNKR